MKNRSIDEIAHAIVRVEQKLEYTGLKPRERHIYEGLHRIYTDEAKEAGAYTLYEDSLKWHFNYISNKLKGKQ